jgi:2-phospho-L-lactate/phosphoenolpyruvate guanylyltransferase
LRATAVLPVKRFAAAKRRLAAGIDEARRQALVAAMLDDVLAALAAARSIERTIVVSDEPRAIEAAAAVDALVVADPGGDEGKGASGTHGASEGSTVPSGPGASGGPPLESIDTARRSSGGHSVAALAGVAAAEGQGAACVVLVPGDCPLLDPRQLDRLLTGVPSRYVAVVPDRHGAGTNALLLAPPDAIRPAFGEGSCDRHVGAAREAGIPFAIEEVPSLALDLDTPADVVALTRELEAHPGRAARTAKVLGL